MILLGINIRNSCNNVNCRLFFIPTNACFGCSHYIQFDVSKIIEDLFQIKEKAEEQGRDVFEVIIKNNTIIKILYDIPGG